MIKEEYTGNNLTAFVNNIKIGTISRLCYTLSVEDIETDKARRVIVGSLQFEKPLEIEIPGDDGKFDLTFIGENKGTKIVSAIFGVQIIQWTLDKTGASFVASNCSAWIPVKE